MSNTEAQCSQLKGLKYKMSIFVPSKEVKNALNTQSRKVQMQASLPGFRKGKVPLDYIKKNYAQQIIVDATDSLIGKVFSAEVTKKGLNPAGPPKIDFQPLEEDKDFTCELIFEVHPKVEVKNYENIKVKVKRESVETKHVDQVIEDLKKTQPMKDLKKPDKADPSLSEEDLWAQSLREKDMASLRKNIEEHLKVKADQVYQDQLKEQILDQLITSNKIEIPEVVLKSQADNIMSSTKHNLQHQGKSESEIKEFFKQNEKELDKQSMKHSQVSYLIHALSQQCSLSVSKEEVLKVLKAAGQPEPYEDSFVNSVRWQMIQSKVLDHLAEKADIQS